MTTTNTIAPIELYVSFPETRELSALMVWLNAYDRLESRVEASIITSPKVVDDFDELFHSRREGAVRTRSICGHKLVEVDVSALSWPQTLDCAHTALVLAALPVIGPALVLRPQMVVTRDPQEVLLSFARAPFAMLPSERTGGRVEITKSSGSLLLPVHDDRVMAFPDPSAAFREALVEDFQGACSAIAQHAPVTTAGAWSVVLDWAEGQLLPLGWVGALR